MSRAPWGCPTQHCGSPGTLKSIQIDTYEHSLFQEVHSRKETALKWKHLAEIADSTPPHFESAESGLLLGTSCSRTIKPREVKPGQDDQPWAVRTMLGWGIVGSRGTADNANMCRYVNQRGGSRGVFHFSFKIQTRESPRDVLRVLERGFQKTTDKMIQGTSVEDR